MSQGMNSNAKQRKPIKVTQTNAMQSSAKKVSAAPSIARQRQAMPDMSKQILQAMESQFQAMA
eukprot:5096520-Pyramimonas_sp.AAC.1